MVPSDNKILAYDRTMSKPQFLKNRTHLRRHFIYYNLHKRCWSLKSTQSNEAGPMGVFHPSVKGLVTGHADTVLATRITCKVSEAGRQRVIRENRKNVHAGIVATTCIANPRGKFPTSTLTRKCRTTRTSVATSTIGEPAEPSQTQPTRS